MTSFQNAQPPGKAGGSECWLGAEYTALEGEGRAYVVRGTQLLPESSRGVFSSEASLNLALLFLAILAPADVAGDRGSPATGYIKELSLWEFRK